MVSGDGYCMRQGGGSTGATFPNTPSAQGLHYQLQPRLFFFLMFFPVTQSESKFDGLLGCEERDPPLQVNGPGHHRHHVGGQIRLIRESHRTGRDMSVCVERAQHSTKLIEP